MVWFCMWKESSVGRWLNCGLQTRQASSLTSGETPHEYQAGCDESFCGTPHQNRKNAESPAIAITTQMDEKNSVDWSITT